MASIRFHPRFPNVPLTQKVLPAQGANTVNCDVCNIPVVPGDVVWNNQDRDIDILDIAMPPVDIRFHDIAPKVPLRKYQLTAQIQQQLGAITCDASKKVANIGDWLWGNRNQNIDILDQVMPSFVAMPGLSGPPAGQPLPGQQAPPGPMDTSLRFVTIEKGFSSGVSDGQNRVIKDTTGWGQFWAMHQSRSHPPAPVPVVDFKKYMVICVNAGTKNTGGYAIEVKSVMTQGTTEGRAVIGVETSSPPPGCMTTMAITQPYHIVKVPRMDTPVAFEAVAPGSGYVARPGESPPLQPIVPLVKATFPPPANAVHAANRLGAEILQAAQELQGDASAFVSPVSIYVALALTVNGAGPNSITKDGIMTAMNALSISGGLSALNTQLQNLCTMLTSTDPRVTFSAANSVWSLVLSQAFIRTCSAVFGAEARIQKPEPVPINEWCYQKTNGKISGVMDPQAPLDAQGAVLVNALYFKGQWKNKFEAMQTVDADFFLSSGKKSCKMMTAKGEKDKFLYFETDTYQAASLPYGDKGDYSAMLLLPRNGSAATLTMRPGNGKTPPPAAAKAPRASNPKELLAHVDWSDLAARGTMTKGRLRLPRFKVEFKVELKDILERRGMTVAFTDGADFSAMSAVPLKIENVIHKTLVEVNEEGTEAAAVMAVAAPSSAAMPMPEPNFEMTCDRPFVFCIRHDKSGALLFCGVVENPS